MITLIVSIFAGFFRFLPACFIVYQKKEKRILRSNLREKVSRYFNSFV